MLYSNIYAKIIKGRVNNSVNEKTAFTFIMRYNNTKSCIL